MADGRWLVGGGWQWAMHKNTCKRLSAYCLALSRFYDCTQDSAGLILLILHVLQVAVQEEEEALAWPETGKQEPPIPNTHRLAINFYGRVSHKRPVDGAHAVDQYFNTIGGTYMPRFIKHSCPASWLAKSNYGLTIRTPVDYPFLG